MKLLFDVYKTLLDWIFPRRCPICDEVMVQDKKRSVRICPDCYDRLPFVSEPNCNICGRALSGETELICNNCKRQKFSFERGLVLLEYNEEIRKSVAAVKYKGRREYLEFYGEEAARRLGEEIRAMGIDGIVPVPIHYRRKNKRGYNQAEIFADVLGKSLDIGVYPKALRRKRNTRAMKELGAAERRRNLSHAIVPGSYPAKSRSLLLVDDIFTTGATMESCSRVLKAMGAERVFCLSLCAPKDEPV